jgi:transposase
MNIRHVVELTQEERDQLNSLIAGGKASVRRTKRAQILLASDAGCGDTEIARTVRVGTSTVYRTKRRLVDGGIEHALAEQRRPGGERKLSGHDEALLVAITCSAPPAGRTRWTLQLLADEVVRLTEHTRISRDTIRRRLAENELKPWQKRMWCVPKVDAEFVARMEDVLELYTTPAKRGHPVVCFDETPVQLVAEVRAPLPVLPGSPARLDYEYRRNGTANLFVFLDVHRPWRHVKVTEHRSACDFADCMKDLVDIHYPKADRIVVVLDNLSTHTPAALYQAFAAQEARRVLRRLEFHYVPKHASWLNMVEIEIGVLVRQCLDRRVPDTTTLRSEIASWQAARNSSGSRIEWMFGIDQARAKLGRSYPHWQPGEPMRVAA